MEKELSRISRQNKTLVYFGLRSSALASKTETTKWEKPKLNITLEVLTEVSVEFSETKQFIEDHLEQKFVKENISVEELIYFLANLEAKK